MKPIKLFNTQQEMDEYIEQSTTTTQLLFLYSEKEFGSVVCDAKQPEITSRYLYGSRNTDDYDREIDMFEFFEFDGTIDWEGETYFKWIKRGADHNSRGFMLLTDTDDFSNVSIDNPYTPIGYIDADGNDNTYHWTDMGGKIYEYRTTMHHPLPARDTDSMDKNGQEYVDLGLPSHILWSKYNVGAQSETDYGLYFQYGDIVGYTGDDAKDHSYWSTCPFNNGSSSYNESYFLAHKSEWLDDNDVLKLEYDAARHHLGGDWHMPTNKEYMELLVFTTSEWVTDYEGSGVNGQLLTSIINGNTLFIPAAGYFSDGYFYDEGSYGYYWSSRLSSSDPNDAFQLSFNSGYVNMDGHERLYGYPVRGVLS